MRRAWVTSAVSCLLTTVLVGCAVQQPPESPAPSPTPTQTVRSFPDVHTTGVPEGTELTDYTGPCSIDTPDVVIDAKTINCDLRILAKGIVITRSVINGSLYTDLSFSPGSFVVSDSEIRAPAETGTGIGEGNFVATRVEVTGGSRSVNCYRDCVLEYSYIHGQYADQRGIDHESGVRMGSNSIIRGNTIACDAPYIPPDAGCSAGLTGYGDFDVVQDNTIEGNLFVAGSGGYCAYGGSTQGKPYSKGVKNIRFINNVWQRGESGKCGDYGPITSFDPDRPGNIWTNNRWDDGTVVPPAN